MSIALSLALALASAAAQAALDPVAACRAEHGDNPPAHIACLEAALQARAPAPAPAVTPAAAAVKEPTGLGAEQARARLGVREAPEQEVRVEIASVSYNYEGRGIFTMADGQVWRETEATPSHQRLKPGRRYTARIAPAAIGSYRMYVDGVRRMIKLERLK